MSPLVLVLLLPARLGAQELPPAWASVAPSIPEATAPPAGVLQKKWIRPLGSLLVPGSGQLMAGQSRGLVYLAAELWIASRAIASGRRGRHGAARFRDLAFDVARRQFAVNRRDGPWDYYESMEKFVESGAYNAGSPTAFAPEPDSTTFNGSVWSLARRTFFVNPDSAPSPSSPQYQAALAFYQTHAIGDDLRWSWRGARLEQDVYRSEIRASDDAFRERTNYFGALVLNHLASTIDALISLKLGSRRPAVPQLRFGMAPTDVELGWQVRF